MKNTPVQLPLIFILSLFHMVNGYAVEARPDLVPVADVAKNYVYGWQLDTTTQPGRTLLRLATAMSNKGVGPLEIWGGATSGNTQQVYQRVYNSNGTAYDRLTGNFIYHPEHGHVHFNGFAIYNIRRVLTGGAVGDIIAAGQKTSFCLINIDNYWPTVTANALVRHGRGGTACGQTQGISAGYADIYSRNLPDQWVDVTAVPSGTYWLEVVADPDNQILESDETNNIVRIQVNYTNPNPPPTNRPPTITSPGALTSTRGDSVSLQINATDVDGDPLTYSATGLPLGLSINTATGLISGNVSLGAAASYDTQIIVSDGRVQSSVGFVWSTVAQLNGTGLLGEYYDGVAFNSFQLSQLDPSINFDWLAGTPNSLLGVDTFCLRWRGRVVPQFTQTYTFFVQADDGARLWVNNVLIVDRWNSSAGETSGTIALQAGQEADIKLEYFENTGNANARLSWSSPSQGKQVVPTHRMFPAPGNRAPQMFDPGPQNSVVGTLANLPINATDADGDPLTYSATGLPAGLTINSLSGLISGTHSSVGNFSTTVSAFDGRVSSNVTFTWSVTASQVGTGLLGTYFTGRQFNAQVAQRTDPVINFDWGWQGTEPLPGVGSDNYSIRWTGEILPQFSDNYTFTIPSDNGCRLWINDMLVISQWDPVGGEDRGTFTGSLSLQAGLRTKIKLEYYEGGGGAGISLFWSSPNVPMELVPTARLFPVADSHANDDHIRPSLTLTTGSPTIQGPFSVAVNFSEVVTGLVAADFSLSAGTITSFTGSGASYTLSINPPSAAGTFSIYLPENRANDAANNGNTQSNVLNLTYTPNQPPYFPNPVTDQTSARGSSVTVSFIALDSDGTVASYSAANLPLGLSIVPSTGVISGMVSATATNSYASTITATDNLGASTTKSFVWNIVNAPSNPAPTVRLVRLTDGAYAEDVVRVEFSEPVTGLELTDFASRAVPGLVYSNLQGSGASYTVSARGQASAPSGTMYLPAGKVIDATGIANTESNNLSVSTDMNPAANSVIVRQPANQRSTLGQSVSLQLQLEFSNVAVSWSATGLPTGLTINPSSGLISGTIGAAAATRNLVSVKGSATGAAKTFLWSTVTANGLIGDYFTGLNHDTRVFSRMDQTVNFEWQGGSPNGAVPIDQFSVRWTGEVTPAYTEDYTIVTNADNGIRVWVNNVKVIDQYNTAGNPGGTTLGTVRLTAGVRVPIRVEYFEGGGWASVSLIWYSASQGWEVIPASRLNPAAANLSPTLSSIGNVSSRVGTAVSVPLESSDVDAGDQVCLAGANLPPGIFVDPNDNTIKGTPTVAGTYNSTLLASDGKSVTTVPFVWTINAPSSGLTAKYYAGRNFETLISERIDPNINFYWSTNSPAAGVPVDNFSVRWTGCVVPAYTQTYTFYTRCDDGVRLWVNNQLLIDTWAVPTTAERSATIALTANQIYTLKMEYYEATSYARAELSWSSASVAKQIIPSARLLVNETIVPGTITPQQEADSPNSTPALLALLTDTQPLQRSLRLQRTTGNKYDVVFSVPAGTGTVAAYKLQSSTTMQTWTDITASPTVTAQSDGTNEIRYANASSLPGTSASKAYFRVKIVPGS